MATASDLPDYRLPIGQLLGRLLGEFRLELFEPAAQAGYPDIRQSHLLILGNIPFRGVRLTELAARSQLSLAATSEMVDNLVGLGYLERKPDARDGRAKLIAPTERGRGLLANARNRVAEIEGAWGELVGVDRFEAACETLQDILTALRAEA